MNLFTRISTCTVVAATLWSTTDAMAGGRFGGSCHRPQHVWSAPHVYHSTPYQYPSHHYHSNYSVPAYVAPSGPPPVLVPSGARISLAGNFGHDGEASLKINNVRLVLTVEEWSHTGIIVTLPAVQLHGPQRAAIEVVSYDGRSELIPIILSPQPRVAVIDELPPGGGSGAATVVTVE